MPAYATHVSRIQSQRREEHQPRNSANRRLYCNSLGIGRSESVLPQPSETMSSGQGSLKAGVVTILREQCPSGSNSRVPIIMFTATHIVRSTPSFSLLCKVLRGSCGVAICCGERVVHLTRIRVTSAHGGLWSKRAGLALSHGDGRYFRYEDTYCALKWTLLTRGLISIMIRIGLVVWRDMTEKTC